MSNNFKAGDRVRFKATEAVYARGYPTEIRPGDTGTVTWVSDKLVSVELDRPCVSSRTFPHRWEKIEEPTTRRPQVGDKVRIKAGVHEGGTGTIIEDDKEDEDIPHGQPFHVRFDNPSSYLLGTGWYAARELEVTSTTAPETPSQKFIISLYEGGKYRPATEPRTYTSNEQATKAAREMSRKHAGRVFVVFQATSYSVTPPAPEVATKAL